MSHKRKKLFSFRRDWRVVIHLLNLDLSVPGSHSRKLRDGLAERRLHEFIIVFGCQLRVRVRIYFILPPLLLDCLWLRFFVFIGILDWAVLVRVDVYGWRAWAHRLHGVIVVQGIIRCLVNRHVQWTELSLNQLRILDTVTLLQQFWSLAAPDLRQLEPGTVISVVTLVNEVSWGVHVNSAGLVLQGCVLLMIWSFHIWLERLRREVRCLVDRSLIICQVMVWVDLDHDLLAGFRACVHDWGRGLYVVDTGYSLSFSLLEIWLCLINVHIVLISRSVSSAGRKRSDTVV